MSKQRKSYPKLFLIQKTKKKVTFYKPTRDLISKINKKKFQDLNQKAII